MSDRELSDGEQAFVGLVFALPILLLLVILIWGIFYIVCNEMIEYYIDIDLHKEYIKPFIKGLFALRGRA